MSQTLWCPEIRGTMYKHLCNLYTVKPKCPVEESRVPPEISSYRGRVFLSTGFSPQSFYLPHELSMGSRLVSSALRQSSLLYEVIKHIPYHCGTYMDKHLSLISCSVLLMYLLFIYPCVEIHRWILTVPQMLYTRLVLVCESYQNLRVANVNALTTLGTVMQWHIKFKFSSAVRKQKPAKYFFLGN